MSDAERFVCTASDPWTPEKGKRAIHPDAKVVHTDSDWFDGHDYDDYECPHCGRKFTSQVSR